ncbi:MAG: hypothetical protein FGM15_11215 [Chthoniobacterales bacterium]|nr:hypothetical protein [Chthoniobacterales bacterium]
MKQQLKSISVLQSSKVVAALYAVIGIFYALVGIPLLIGAILAGKKELMAMGVMFLLMPVFTALAGFVFFAIFAAIYNLLARWLGGIEVEIVPSK